MNLLEFYNNIFKPEIRDALNKDYISRKLLSTPLRQDLNMNRNVTATPLSGMLNHNPDSSFFNSKSIIKAPTEVSTCQYNEESLSK
jgi:hypothetical protein